MISYMSHSAYLIDASASGSAIRSGYDAQTQSYIIVSCVLALVVIIVVVMVGLLLYRKRRQLRSKSATLDTEISTASQPNISEFLPLFL